MTGQSSPAAVVAVSLNTAHQFSKPVQKSIRLLTGLGVEGDAHLKANFGHGRPLRPRGERPRGR